jgi:ABC-type glycerol-3-phosphate transport system substrate-binding protein
VIATRYNPSERARQALAAAYRRHQPDVELVWMTDDYPDATSYARWLEQQLAANNVGLDIVSGNYAPSFRRYVNLDEYRLQVNPYTGREWEKDYDFARYPEVDARGERTSIGAEATHLLFYYNKDIFADVGVEPPSDFTQLLDVCAKLHAARRKPLALSFDPVVTSWMSSVYFDQYHDAWVDTVRAQPGDWCWDPELDGKFEYDSKDPRLHTRYTFNPQRFYQGLADRTLRFDTPAMLDLVTNLTKLVPRYATADFFTSSSSYLAFLRGQAAMLVDGAWTMYQLAQDLAGPTPGRLQQLGLQEETVKPFEWDVFEFPPMRGPLVQSELRPFEGTTGNHLSVVDKGPDHTEMVMDFLMFWVSDEGYTAFLQGEAKANALTPQGPLLVSGVSYDRQVEDLFAKVRLRGSIPPAYGTFWVLGAGGRSTVDLRNHFVSVLQGKFDPQDYATRLQRYVESHLDEMMETAGLSADDVANPARRPAML